MKCDFCKEEKWAVVLVHPDHKLCYTCVSNLQMTSPDLLEALELVVAQFEGITDDKWATKGIRVAIEKARAAIAKAKGKTT